MYSILLGFITAFVVAYLIIPSILVISHKKKLFDKPNERSSHIQPTPSLGGIAIFAGAIIAIILWTPFSRFVYLQYILAAFLILFLIGVKDDLLNISPTKKLAAQFAASLVIILLSKIRLYSLYGILWIDKLDPWLGFLLSLIILIGVINAYNLIDGINGLAGSLGLIACTVFGTIFFLSDRTELSVMAFSMAGAILAFLKFNLMPNKLFMGDTGSMILGAMAAVMSLEFIRLSEDTTIVEKYPYFQVAPAIAFAVLLYPIFDLSRVFLLRTLAGRSPMSADRNHHHHLLIDLGFSHKQATGIIVTVKLLLILIAFLAYRLGNNLLLILLFCIALALSVSLHYIAKNRKNKILNI